MNYFPNATFIEWLWTVMNFIGVIASVINATVIYTRGKRVLANHALIVTTRAVALLFVQRVIRSNILGIITTLFTILGALVIVASSAPGEGLSRYVGSIFGICIFVVGLLITGYQILEMVMRSEIDDAIEAVMVTDGGEWDGVERRGK